MAYRPSGLMPLFPIYLARMAAKDAGRDEYDALVAQNEVNLNQNLDILFQKLLEIEQYLGQQSE